MSRNLLLGIRAGGFVFMPVAYPVVRLVMTMPEVSHRMYLDIIVDPVDVENIYLRLYLSLLLSVPLLCLLNSRQER